MLKEIRIKNFQSWSSLVLELDEGVNTIIGPTDIGKSAIIRAIRFTALNQPAGTAFIKDGQDKSKIKIKTKNNQVVRIRGKTTNTYLVNGKKLEAFGQTIPPAVSKALNISDINFQQQHDSPFWFSETAGEVSRKLNEIVHLQVIDSTLSNLDSVKRQTSAEIEVYRRSVKKASEQKKNLAYVKDMNAELIRLEKIQSSNINLSQTCDLLGELIERHIIVTSAQKNAGDAASEGLLWLKKARSWGKLSEKVENLVDLVQIIRNRSKVAQNRPGSIIHLEKQIKDIELLKERISTLKYYVKRYETSEKQEAFYLELYRTSKKKLEKEMGKTCPLCGSKLKYERRSRNN